jgi:hypothetical protein
MIKEDKIIDKDLLIKYLKYLIDYSTQILENKGNNDFIGDDYDAIVKEYTLFVTRINKNGNIDAELKKLLTSQNLQSDITDEPEIIQAINAFKGLLVTTIGSIFLKGIPSFLMSFINSRYLLSRDQMTANIRELRDRLSNILFKIESY